MIFLTLDFTAGKNRGNVSSSCDVPVIYRKEAGIICVKSEEKQGYGTAVEGGILFGEDERMVKWEFFAMCGASKCQNYM